MLAGLLWQMQCLTLLYARVGNELWKPHCGRCEALLSSIGLDRGEDLHQTCKLHCMPEHGKGEAELSCRSLNHQEGN